MASPTVSANKGSSPSSSLERLMRPTSASSARASSTRAERRQRETALEKEKARHDKGKGKGKGKREKEEEGGGGDRVRYNREAAKEAVRVYPAVTAEELLEKANDSSGGGEETVRNQKERDGEME
jgi:hypothetical protein